MQLGYEINTRNLREHIFGEVSNRFGKPELQGIYSDNFTKQPAIQKNRITNEFVSVDNGEGSSILLEQICKMSHSVVYESTDGMKWKLLVVGTSVIIDVSKNSQFTRDSLVSLLDFIEKLSCVRILMCLNKKLTSLNNIMKLLSYYDFKLVSSVGQREMLYMEYLEC